MVAALRHLLAIAALPFVVAVVIPQWLASRNNIVPVLGGSPARDISQTTGVVVLGVGLLLFASSLRRFAGDGNGTLAPWDPPCRLVVSGPYRYVRNPMISGVILVLFGEALVLVSEPHAVWALTFLAVNFLYIPVLEEPQLRDRFGASYVEYLQARASFDSAAPSVGAASVIFVTFATAGDRDHSRYYRGALATDFYRGGL